MSLLLAQAVQEPNDAYLWWGIALTAAALVLFFIELLVPTGGDSGPAVRDRGDWVHHCVLHV